MNNKCKHIEVKQAFAKTGYEHGNYTCPDCIKPIDCSNLEGKLSCKIAIYSMAGCENYRIQL